MNTTQLFEMRSARLAMVLLAAMISGRATAQTPDKTDRPGMDMSSMQHTDNQRPITGGSAPRAKVDHLRWGSMNGSRPDPAGLAAGAQQMDMSHGGQMDMTGMQGGKAPPNARSPDYSDGYRDSDMPGMDMSDHDRQSMLLLDQFEYAQDSHGASSGFWDGELWYGADFNKLWLKSEGSYSGGQLEDVRTEALWDHALSAYWGSQLGVRHDLGRGPDRTWAAFGVQGLAPYWFDTEAALYIGEEGRVAARVQVEYEELLTQRLILQPKFEVNLYSKDDPARGIGSGLSDSELGLRLRYEVRREVAPYAGVVWRQRYGRTADLSRAAGEPSGELQVVAGVRFWF
jgi:copper resistance protein B